MEQVLDWLKELAILLLGGGGGILYSKYRKKSEAAKARKDDVDADLAEISAYKTRIKSLGEEVETLEKRISELQTKCFETEQAYNSAMSLASKQEVVIAELNERIRIADESIAQLKAKNAEASRQNSALKGQITKLKKQNEKYEAD